ncbi:MAG: histidine kinase [Christensenellaceae bacterium]|nr:histidine kinase [Christensenellaceae bacterium]
MKKSAGFFGIKKKLILCFMLIVFVMGMICMMVFISNILVSQRYTKIYESNALIIQISNEVSALEEATKLYLSTKTTESLEDAHELMNSLGLLTYEFKTYPPDSDIHMMMIDISQMTDTLMSEVNTTLLAKITRNSEQYTQSFEKINRLTGYLETTCLRLNKLLTEENNRELADYTARQKTFNMVIILSFSVVSFACVAYIVFQSNSISKPIIELSEGAHAISSGDFSKPDIACDSHDEIGQMALAFNNMKIDIKESMDRLERQRQLEAILKEEQVNNLQIQAMLKDAEFVALQSQIQPHFLFNTINAGIQIAYSENADQTIEFLANMAGLFRYNLKNMQEPVTLSAEIEQVERYLYLLRKRFDDMFSFNIRVDIPRHICNQLKMPLMILQPLVENCYAHGIREMISDGRIDITVCEENGYYAVKITDNGVGISAENVEKLMRGEKTANGAERSKSLGIGVRNVRRRLIVFYERQDVMHIESIPGSGTTVTVYLEEISQ